MTDDPAPPGPRRSPRASTLLVEFASVVFAVLLALGVNAWWQSRQDAHLAEETTRAIAGEIRRNRAELLGGVAAEEEARPLEGLSAALEAFRRDEEPGEVAVNWDVALLSSAAWETARLTGATRDMPLDRVVDLAELYELQRYFLRTQDELTSLIAETGATMETRPLEGLSRLRSRMATASGLRRTLATIYACALVGIEGPGAVEEGACPGEPSEPGTGEAAEG